MGSCLHQVQQLCIQQEYHSTNIQFNAEWWMNRLGLHGTSDHGVFIINYILIMSDK